MIDSSELANHTDITTEGRTMTEQTALETPIEGLWATPPAPLPFDSTVDVRAFLLERPHGNLIVYDAPGLAAAAGEIQARGGATRQLLNHAHEAKFGSQGLDAGAFVGEGDRDHARSLPIAGTFSERQTLDDEPEVFPTAGHTPGPTTFLWDSGRHRSLFTGDTLWIEHGNGRATVLGESDRDAYLDRPRAAARARVRRPRPLGSHSWRAVHRRGQPHPGTATPRRNHRSRTGGRTR